LPRIKASEIKVVEREIEERKESMWLLRSWVQIIPPGPFLSVRELRYCFELILNKCRTNSAGSLLLATKNASYYILEEVSLNTSVTLKHYS
jgi:hypothetical protein